MSAPFVVRESDLIATVPKMLAVAFASLPGLQVLPLPFELDPIPIRQYWSEIQHKDAGQIWLRRLVANLFVEGDPTASISFA